MQRADLLPELKDLAPVDWVRSAIILHRIHTVFTQGRQMAKHEREHCDQFEALLNKQ